MAFRNISIVMTACMYICLTGMSTARAGDLVVIANKGVAIETIPQSVISDIYMNKKTTWDSGEQLVVVLMVKGVTHNRFVKDVLNTTAYNLRQIWQQVIFSGQGKIPFIVKQESDVVERVQNTEGAIGYIDSETPHEGVKEIFSLK